MAEAKLEFLERGIPEVSGVYKWTFPGAPIRIDIRLDVIRRLRAAIMASDAEGCPSLIGGVLLGHSSSTGTHVSDYVLLPNEADSRPEYVLTVPALNDLRASREDDPSIVGFFRTQVEPNLALRDDEMEMVRRHFNGPEQVVLLIGTSHRQNTAGFLFWDGDILNPFSFMEFPLDSKQLRNKTSIASSEPAPTPVPAPALVEKVQAEAVAAEPLTKDQPKSWLAGRIVPLAVVLGLVVVAALLIGNRYTGDRSGAPLKPEVPVPAPTIAVAPPTFPLHLEVEAQGNGLNVRWNPASVAVTPALKGRLVIIDDGKDTQILTLAHEQLMNGHVYYQSSSKHLEFQLEVVNDSGVVAKESVLALSSRPAPYPTGIPYAARPTPAPTPVDPAKVPETNVAKPAPRVFAGLPQRRETPAEAKPIPADLATPLPNVPLSAPNAALAGTMSPIGTTPMQVAVAPPKPPPVVRPIPAAVPKAPVERYQAPVPKNKTSPQLAPAVSALLPVDSKIEIAVRVQIDDTGRVIGGRTLAQHSPAAVSGGIYRQLESAAVDAVTHWRYEPARLGTRPVASEDEVVFLFQRR